MKSEGLGVLTHLDLLLIEPLSEIFKFCFHDLDTLLTLIVETGALIGCILINNYNLLNEVLATILSFLQLILNQADLEL